MGEREMARIANIVGALLFASICLAAAVLAGANAAGADASEARSPRACCVYLIF
jgi:hypothetical protein